MAKKKNIPAAARTANPDFQRAMHGLGSSSATQPHTPAPRKGTRTENVRRAIREQIQY